MEKSRVDEIVLVGGSTRIPMVQSMLQEYFNGKKLCKRVNPDEAVAYGAAVLAAKLSGSNKVRDFVLEDVIPLSIGIEITGNVFHVEIPRNTPIPTKIYNTYITNWDNQHVATLGVYQGERARATDNHLLGEFRITWFPPARRGDGEFKTCYEIDANGIVAVTATIESTGKTEKLIITNEKRRISNDEIERMVNDARKFQQEDEEFKAKAFERLKYGSTSKASEEDRKVCSKKDMEVKYEIHHHHHIYDYPYISEPSIFDTFSDENQAGSCTIQ